MSTTLTVTAKGQVTLRRSLLEHLGVAPGDKIVLDLLPSGLAQLRAAKAPGSLDRFIGRLTSSERPALTIEQMNEIAAAGWSRRGPVASR